MASEECSSLLSDSEESGLSTPPPKKRCGHAQKGAATYKTAYNPEWAKSYPVSVVNGNNYAFYCVPCKKNVQCGHMGIGDVKQHCRSALHRKMEAAIKSSRSLLTYSSASSSSDLSEKTIKAEVLHTNFIVQHNLSFMTADHLSPLYAKMFPDSKIAKNFKCCRTKTACILNQAMYPLSKKHLVTYMKENPFSFCHDGSSDTSVKKMNPVCVSIFDASTSKSVETKFYDMCATTGEDCGKAKTLFEAIDSNFTRDSISWANTVAVGLDNTAVNMGCNNSIKVRVLEKNSNCFIAGCNCHLLHLAASKGADAYYQVTGFDVEDHSVDIYYYFSKSTKRKGVLMEYFDFVDLEWEEVVRYVSTRWLSLEKCCDRELKSFPALKAMFLSRDESDARFLRLKHSFEDILTEVHISFYTSALPMFTRYNKFLQRSDPLAHKIFPLAKSLIRKIANRFIKPDILQQTEAEDILSIVDDDSSCLPLSDIFLGLVTKYLLNKLLNEGDISEDQWKLCMNGAIAFLRQSLKYVIQHMDMRGTVWEHATWIDFSERTSARWSDVEYFCEKFNDILNFDEHTYELLHEEFLDYRTLLESDLPKCAFEEALIRENSEGKEYRMDIIWYYIQQLKNPAASNSRFKNLFQVARLVLLMPNSNAGIERLFSLVNKNKKDGADRSRLDIEGSLSSILTVKLDRPESESKCYNFLPSAELLHDSKKATNTYNKEHSRA